MSAEEEDRRDAESLRQRIALREDEERAENERNEILDGLM